MGAPNTAPRGRRLKTEQRAQLLEALRQLEESHNALVAAVADLGIASRELGAAARRLNAFLAGAQPWRMTGNEPIPPARLPRETSSSEH